MKLNPTPALVAGVGNPWLGDLDFGPRFARRYADGAWPAGTTVEEAAVAGHLFLHRLAEVRPERLVLVAAHPRGGPAGCIRTWRPDGPPAPDEEIQARLGESVSGVIDLEHLMAIAQHFDALPPRTTVVEVEPGDSRFGEALTPALERAFEPVRRLVLETLEA